MRKLFCILFFLSYATLANATEIDFPYLSGQVVDEVGVLTPETKAKLSKILAADKNNQVAVAILKNLRGQDGREYGLELARHWQLGQKGKDNGVLIFLSPEDHYVGIEVGYGLEGVLPDSLSGRIIREVIIPPIKRDNDYNQAVLNGAAVVMSVVSDGQVAREDTSEDVLYMIMMFIFLWLLLSGKGRWGGGGGLFLPRGGFGGGFGSGFRGGGGGFGGGGAGGRF